MIKHTLKLNMNLMYYDCFDWTISAFNKIYIHKKIVIQVLIPRENTVNIITHTPVGTYTQCLLRITLTLKCYYKLFNVWVLLAFLSHYQRVFLWIVFYVLYQFYHFSNITSSCIMMLKYYVFTHQFVLLKI